MSAQTELARQIAKARTVLDMIEESDKPPTFHLTAMLSIGFDALFTAANHHGCLPEGWVDRLHPSTEEEATQ